MRNYGLLQGKYNRNVSLNRVPDFIWVKGLERHLEYVIDLKSLSEELSKE